MRTDRPPLSRLVCEYRVVPPILDLKLPVVLRERLSQPLPGFERCAEFAPEMSYGRHAGPPEISARHAAVLVLLYHDGEQWRLPLTVRPPSLLVHAGQVCFPGGMIEAGESIEGAALRECREELGTAGEGTELLGRLSPMYVFASNHLVTPVVAWTRNRPEFIPNPVEVANLIEPSLVELLDTKRHGAHLIERRSIRFRAPHFEWEGQRIWGATCLMLAELLAVIR